MDLFNSKIGLYSLLKNKKFNPNKVLDEVNYAEELKQQQEELIKLQALWDDYTKYKEVMFETTHLEITPWSIIDANKKPAARLKAISHILDSIPYK